MCFHRLPWRVSANASNNQLAQRIASALGIGRIAAAVPPSCYVAAANVPPSSRKKLIEKLGEGECCSSATACGTCPCVGAMVSASAA